MGGSSSQLRAFGLLEGGRGLVGAALGTLGVVIFTLFANHNTETVNLEESRAAFKYVIYFSSFIVAFVGLLTWFFMKLKGDQAHSVVVSKISIEQVKQVMKMPAVLLLMVIILCAYMGYKTTDIIALFSRDIMHYNEVQSAQIATFLLYARPIIAILLACFFTRFNATLILGFGFVVSFFAAVIFASGLISDISFLLFILSILILAVGVYGLRAVYFSVMEKGNIPLKYTGTAVGMISLVGYAPDIFSGPMIGYLLDNSKGMVGYQYVFAILAAFSGIGCWAGWKYHVMYGKS